MKFKLLIFATFVACSGAQSKCSSACVFPFVWDGVTYTTCTDVDADHFWCATGMKDGWTTTTTCNDDCSSTGGNGEPAPGLARSSSSSSCRYPDTHTMVMYPEPAADCRVIVSSTTSKSNLSQSEPAELRTSMIAVGWKVWSEWSECSQSCGGGQQMRVRHCEDGQFCGGENNLQCVGVLGWGLG